MVGADVVPSRDAIEAARERIAPHVRTTPVIRTGAGAFGMDVALTLKLELLQHTGSFKPRGAFSKLLASDVPPAGVVAASGGNFGLAVAYACRHLGYEAEIFVPSTSPASKIDRVRAEGATVRVVPGYYDDASAMARARQTETGALAVHPFDQPEGSRCLDAALAAGEPVDVTVDSIAADSLGTRRVGTIAFGSARAYVERVALVPDAAIREAQRRLWCELRLVAEPGGAAALAALMHGAYVPAADERVVVVVCGANGDPGDVIG
jgi:threonine dehydratase